MSHDAHHKAAFFRQSGWLMIANIVGGAMMMGVHLLSKKIPQAEYGSAVALLAATILIPTLPMQMVFTRETATALALGNTRMLASKARKSVLALFLVWLLFALVVFFSQNTILEKWNISQPATLWLFVFVALAALVTPVFGGLIQGKQDFFWLGWTMMLNAFLRIGLAAIIIFFITQTAAGFMGGVLVGMVVVLAIMIWQTRDLWAGKTEPFETRSFLHQVVPLMIGFGACQILFSADTVIVGRFFSATETGSYGAAGTLSRGLMWLVLPLATVMFPKLVHHSAKAEKSNLLGLTLIGTTALAVVGAAGLTLLGAFVVRIVYTPAYVESVTAIIPWYAGAMIPLSLANVLVNNLLARADYRIVPWVAILAVGYAVTLWLWHPDVKSVLQVLTAFTSVTFVICAAFTWNFPAKLKAAVT